MLLKAVLAAQVLAATVMTLGPLNTQSNISMAKISQGEVQSTSTSIIRLGM